MSHESVPEHPGQTGQAAEHQAHQGHQDSGVPTQGGAAPKGLLQQMEELMAALNADLSDLDADLQSSTGRSAGTIATPGRAVESEQPFGAR
ncbi:hypothetical protein ACIBEA_17010 [Streptomyces sp. NPDC051555]|uniref:hypothetical protein n=1 Tax=Streptomyces sp. NPDC051555 TaxID=3365657 RepID=UPI003787FD82